MTNEVVPYRDFIPGEVITRLKFRIFHACENGYHTSCRAVRISGLGEEHPVDVCKCMCHL